MTTRWVHIRVDEELHEKIRAAAAADHRSVSNWAAHTIERVLEESQPEVPDGAQ